jgi:cyclic pyranopterin phosphate synthase
VTLSHVSVEGRAQMVDVGDKPESARTARAAGAIRMSEDALALVGRNQGPKGDVLSTAELAGVMAAKRTAELIPLCHQVPLDRVTVEGVTDPALPGVRMEATVRAHGRTGVEMEALTAVAVALLTVYDMVKAAGHGMVIGPIRLKEKSGGVGGPWHSDEGDA